MCSILTIAMKRQANSLRTSLKRSIGIISTGGGVYKGQGRNRCKLMTCAYWEFHASAPPPQKKNGGQFTEKRPGLGKLHDQM